MDRWNVAVVVMAGSFVFWGGAVLLIDGVGAIVRRLWTRR